MLTRIVQPSPALETFLDALQLKLSQPQHEHLLHLVDGVLVCDQRKTLAALQRQFLDATDPSNWADFLRISPWSAVEVRDSLRRHQVTWLLELVQARGLPKVLYINLDDSLGKKDKHTSHIEPVDRRFGPVRIGVLNQGAYPLLHPPPRADPGLSTVLASALLLSAGATSPRPGSIGRCCARHGRSARSASVAGGPTPRPARGLLAGLEGLV